MKIPKKRLAPLIIAIVIAVATSIFLYTNVKVYKVYGSSMEPTYPEHSLILLKKSKLKPGVLVIYSPEEKFCQQCNNHLKRVVATPNSTVEFSEKGIEVDGKLVTKTDENCTDREPLKVTLTNDFIVLGDNRESSLDSLYMWCRGGNPLIPLDRIEFTGRELL